MELMNDVKSVWTKLMDAADSRVENKFLMNSPLPTVIIIACYIYFVKVSTSSFAFEC